MSPSQGAQHISTNTDSNTPSPGADGKGDNPALSGTHETPSFTTSTNIQETFSGNAHEDTTTAERNPTKSSNKGKAAADKGGQITTGAVVSSSTASNSIDNGSQVNADTTVSSNAPMAYSTTMTRALPGTMPLTLDPISQPILSSSLFP